GPVEGPRLQHRDLPGRPAEHQPLLLRGGGAGRRHRLAALQAHHAAAPLTGHVLRPADRRHQLVPGLLAGPRAGARRRAAEQPRGPGLLPLPADVPGVQVRPGRRGVVRPLRDRPRALAAAAALRREEGALRMSYRLGRFFGRFGSYALLIVISAATVFPFVWMLGTALKSQQEIFAYPPTLWPNELHWENFATVLERCPFLRFYLNSLVVTAIITFWQVASATLAGYAFARLSFPFKNVIFTVYIATLIIPNQVTMLPLFLLVSRLGWIETCQGLGVPFLASAFAVFFLGQFFRTIPRELEEAALIDGAGRLRILFLLVLPLARPALATITLFIFLSEWDTYLWPLIATNSEAMRTLPVGLRYFVEE